MKMKMEKREIRRQERRRGKKYINMKGKNMGRRRKEKIKRVR